MGPRVLPRPPLAAVLDGACACDCGVVVQCSVGWPAYAPASRAVCAVRVCLLQFKEYVWVDREFLVEREKENARLGIVKRSRGDGRGKRGLQ